MTSSDGWERPRGGRRAALRAPRSAVPAPLRRLLRRLAHGRGRRGGGGASSRASPVAPFGAAPSAPFARRACAGAGRVSPTRCRPRAGVGRGSTVADGGRRSPICGVDWRREPGFLAGDVGDVVGGETAVGGRVGVVVGDERRRDVVGVVVGVRPPRRSRRSRRSPRRRRRRRWPRRSPRPMATAPPVAPAARAAAPTRAESLAVVAGGPRPWRRTRASQRASPSWDADAARRIGARRKPRRPPASCRRTLVPSLMMRAPPGRARARRLPAVPTARRRARSIVQF